MLILLLYLDRRTSAERNGKDADFKRNESPERD